MMFCALSLAILFFLLVPGVVLYLPKGAKLTTAAAVHALVFFVIVAICQKVKRWIEAKRLEHAAFKRALLGQQMELLVGQEMLRRELAMSRGPIELALA